MKKWPFIVGGVALTLMIGGLAAFVIISRNTDSGVKEFSLCDTWKAVGRHKFDGSDAYPITENEYYVFKDDGTYDYYHIDIQTPEIKGESYTYDMKQNQLKFASVNKYFTLERKTNNLIRLIEGDSLKEFMRWGSHSMSGINVPDDPFGSFKWEITYRNTNKDYKGEYLTFIDGKMSWFDKSNASKGQYDFVKEGKSITIGAIEKVLTIYPFSEETIYMVETAGNPGYTWELTKIS